MSRKKKIKPLLAIMSPRDIPFVKEGMDKIDYVDKVWFKYTPTDETQKRIYKYFLRHKEYTHLIIHSDDGFPDYDHIAMLIADAEKYDFPIISGCCCINKIDEDMFLNLTFNPVAISREIRQLTRGMYHNLPYEFTELNGIVKVWFQGNALAMIRRDVFTKFGVPLKTWIGRFGADLRFCYECWSHNVPQYADLRVYMDHFKYPQGLAPYNLHLDKPAKIIVEKATRRDIPKAEPAKLIKHKNIPNKYMELLDFYHGATRTLKICVVSEFEPKDYFQWYAALWRMKSTPKRYGGAYLVSDQSGHLLQVSRVIMSPLTMKKFSPKHSYWNVLREADLVFVYTARHNEQPSWKWYMLPVWVKKFMRSDAKMIAQFDAEFMWLWHPRHIWWKKNPIIQGKDNFFKESGVLDVADAYFTVLDEPPWAKYCSKPIYYMPLPQMFRYKKSTVRVDRRAIPAKKMIAMLEHSVKSASTTKTIRSVIRKLGMPVIYFSTKNLGHEDKERILRKLPEGSRVYGKLPRDAYMQFLKDAYMAIDDNEGYIGWSRFVQECAICCIPCVGSSKAVEHIFPDLKTEHNDYKKQRTLLRKLSRNINWYKAQMIRGWVSATRSLSDQNLVTKMLKISIFDLKCFTKTIAVERIEYINFINFLVENFRSIQRHNLTRRPREGEKIFDGISKRIIGQKEWDVLYGEWRKIIDDKEKYARCLKIAREKYIHG